MWLFSCKVQSPGSARRIYIEVDFTKRCEMRADSLQPLFVPCGLGTVRKENCAPPAGQKGDMKTASLIRRQKNADFGTKSAAVGRPLPAATGNRSPLQIHNRGFSASNTVLLTCVIGNPPAPTSYLLTGHPCNGGLSSRRIAPLRRGLTRTAPFRVGISACFLTCPTQKSVADMACITVFQYSVLQ